MPGPFSALIAATALKGGFRAGCWIAVVPLATETAVMAVTALALSQLPETVLQWIGFSGGLFVLYLAYRTWQDSGTPPDSAPLTGSTRRVVEGAFLAVLSPTPWVFWLLIGAPLLLGASNQGWRSAALFLGSFLAGLVGMYLGVAALAGLGRRRLPAGWRRGLLKGAAAALLVGGAVLLWQSYVGNFHRMVSGAATLQSVVGDSILGM